MLLSSGTPSVLVSKTQKNQGSKKPRTLLANAAEPPAAAPAVVVAAADHVPPAAPRVERQEVVASVRPLPVGAVGVLVGERRIGLVDGRLRVGIGSESARFVLFRQVSIADIASEFEERDLDLVAFAFGHRLDDRLVGVLAALRGIQHFLRRAGPVDLDRTDERVRQVRAHTVDENVGGLIHDRQIDSAVRDDRLSLVAGQLAHLEALLPHFENVAELIFRRERDLLLRCHSVRHVLGRHCRPPVVLRYLEPPGADSLTYVSGQGISLF